MKRHIHIVVDKSIFEMAKARAKSENRSLLNYITVLISRDLKFVLNNETVDHVSNMSIP